MEWNCRQVGNLYTPKRIAVTARDEWGFRSPKKKRSGGTPLALSSVCRLMAEIERTARERNISP